MKLSKVLTATVVLVAGVSTYNLVNDHSSVNQTNNQASPQYMMSRYSSQAYSSNAQLNWQQLQAYIQQMQEQEQQQIQQLQQQWQQQQQQWSQQTPQPQQTQQSQQVQGGTSLPANTQASQNWSGYVDSPANGSKGYTSVSGSWKVPNVTSNQRDAIAAQWIGLGGVSSQDLLQMGTTEEIQNGQAVANIFWEKLPDVAQNVMTVPIGSTINARIGQANSTTWDIKFTIKTPSGNTESKTIPVTLDSSYAQGIGTSAEWISEDPSNQNDQLYPMANMGTVTYNSAQVDGHAFTAADNQVQPIALVSGNGNVLLAPSSIGADGQSFSTKTLRTDTTSQGYGYYGNGNGGYANRRGFRRSTWGQTTTGGRGHRQNYNNSTSETFTWTW